MKCSSCKFYQKSKMYGNHCKCMGIKPCEVEYRKNKRDKLNKKRRDKYGEEE